MRYRRSISVLLFGLLGLGGEARAQPTGGVGGHAFIIQCDGAERVSAIHVRSGKRIDNIGIECVNVAAEAADPEKVRSRTLGRGGDGGQHHAFPLPVGTFVNQVEVFGGRKSCDADSLRVCGVEVTRSDGGRTLFGTETRGGTMYAASIPQIQRGNVLEVYGFRGRSGNEVDALEPLFRSRNRPRPLTFESTAAQNVADALNTVLGRAEIRLHNWGDRNGEGWHREKASWISLKGGGGGSLWRRAFTIPEYSTRADNGLRRRYFYANDIESTAVFLGFESEHRAFVLRVEFEGKNKEIVSFCRYKKPNGDYKTCIDPDAPPDVEWVQPALEIAMIPAVYNKDGLNGITLETQAARLQGDFRLDGLCGRLPKECKRIITDWEGKLMSTVEEVLAGFLLEDDGRAGEDAGEALSRLLARASRTVLDGFNRRGPVLDAFIDKDRLVVGFNQPPRLTISSPADGDSGSTETFWEFDGKARDPEEGELPIRWESSISGVLNKGTKLGFGGELPEGKHVITATVRDGLGERTIKKLTIDVSNDPPVVEVIAPRPESRVLAGHRLRLVGAGSDPDSKRVLQSEQIRWTVRPLQSGGPQRRPQPVFSGVGSSVVVPAKRLVPGYYIVELSGGDDTGARAGKRVQIFVSPNSPGPRRHVSGVEAGQGFFARKSDDKGAFVKIRAKAETRKGHGLPAGAHAKWYLYHAGTRKLVCDGSHTGHDDGKPKKGKKGNERCETLRLKLYPESPSKPPLLNEYAIGLVIENGKGASSEAIVPFYVSFPLAG